MNITNRPISTKTKKKKCKVCKGGFEPTKPLQAVCGFGCAIELGLRNKAKQASLERTKQRQERRKAKEKLKTRGDYSKEAQAAFNRFIRARDAALPCVSCGRYHQGQYHAGHYRTVGANPELRFCELNVWKQCAPCNDHLHGNIVNYRIELERRIGAAKLAWLEGNHDPKHYSVEELKEIKAKYSKLARELEKQ